MSARTLDVAQLIVRKPHNGTVRILAVEHDKWKNEQGQPYLTLPCKKTRLDVGPTSRRGDSVDAFVTAIAQEDLGLTDGSYWLDEEILPTTVAMDSPSHNVRTDYTLYPISLCLASQELDAVCTRTNGQWLTPEQIEEHKNISPTTRAVVRHLQRRETELDATYDVNPTDEHKAGAPKRLFRGVPETPDADALTRDWAIRNGGDVRILRRQELANMMDACGRAVNLLVSDPYLWYQRQAHGVTWAFFSHRDRQDLHIHPFGVTEFYGVLEGQLEIWWRPYHASGASAWNNRVLSTGDWAEVGALQWHIVRWRGQGHGVVFKAGSGPLAGVGRLGTAGKTNWDDSHGILPPEVRHLMEQLRDTPALAAQSVEEAPHYEPRPIDTRGIELPASLDQLVEQLSDHNHDVWARQRRADGWVWGASRDDHAKTHPSLIAYSELSESEKQYDRNSVVETLKAIVALGYGIAEV